MVHTPWKWIAIFAIISTVSSPTDSSNPAGEREAKELIKTLQTLSIYNKVALEKDDGTLKKFVNGILPSTTTISKHVKDITSSKRFDGVGRHTLENLLEGLIIYTATWKLVIVKADMQSEGEEALKNLLEAVQNVHLKVRRSGAVDVGAKVQSEIQDLTQVLRDLRETLDDAYYNLDQRSLRGFAQEILEHTEELAQNIDEHSALRVLDGVRDDVVKDFLDALVAFKKSWERIVNKAGLQKVGADSIEMLDKSIGNVQRKSSKQTSRAIGSGSKQNSGNEQKPSKLKYVWVAIGILGVGTVLVFGANLIKLRFTGRRLNVSIQPKPSAQSYNNGNTVDNNSRQNPSSSGERDVRNNDGYLLLDIDEDLKDLNVKLNNNFVSNVKLGSDYDS